MKVVAYARVSSRKQVEKGLSISSQLKEIREYAKDEGWDIVNEYVDKAQSARTADRPSFQRMIKDAESNGFNFDAVLIWKHSRFARNRKDSIVYKSKLKDQNVDVISIKQDTDNSPSGQLLEGVIEILDEYRSANLAQDTLRGMVENAKRGYYNGGNPPTGYETVKVDDNGTERSKLVIDDEFAPIIKRIFKMAKDGLGGKSIAKKLNEEGLRTRAGNRWGKSSIYRILKNETYTGTMVWNKDGDSAYAGDEPIRVEDCYPQIIDKETYREVNGLMEQRKPDKASPKNGNSDYMLSGLLKCGNCGASMVGTSAKGGKYHYYNCTTHQKKGKSSCDIDLIPRGKLEKLVVKKLKDVVLTEENLKELVDLVYDKVEEDTEEFEGKLEEVEKRIRKLKEKRDKLYDAIETGEVDVKDLSPRLTQRNDEIEKAQKKRRELRRKIEKIESSNFEPISEEEIKEKVYDLHNLLTKGSFFEQKKFLTKFIEEIVVSPPEVKIKYRFPLEEGGEFVSSEQWLPGLDSNQQPTG